MIILQDKLVQTLDLAHKSLYTYTNKLPIPPSVQNTEAEALLAKLGAKPQVTIRPGRLPNRTIANIAASQPLSVPQGPPPMMYPSASSSHPQFAPMGRPQAHPVNPGIPDMFSHLPGWNVTQDPIALPTGSTDPWITTIPSSILPSSGGQTWEYPLWDAAAVNPAYTGVPGFPSEDEILQTSQDLSHPHFSQFDTYQINSGSAHFM
jgi:hypothetical protein